MCCIHNHKCIFHFGTYFIDADFSTVRKAGGKLLQYLKPGKLDGWKIQLLPRLCKELKLCCTAGVLAAASQICVTGLRASGPPAYSHSVFTDWPYSCFYCLASTNKPILDVITSPLNVQAFL